MTPAGLAFLTWAGGYLALVLAIWPPGRPAAAPRSLAVPLLAWPLAMLALGVLMGLMVLVWLAGASDYVIERGNRFADWLDDIDSGPGPGAATGGTP